jgi:hypothetical protein
MGFKNTIIEAAPWIEKGIPFIFRNIRSVAEQRSLRKRECFYCSGKIERLSHYINHQFRYDGRIVTLSFHKKCYHD